MRSFLSVALFFGVAAASPFSSVTFMHYDDRHCQRLNNTMVREIGACIKEEREGHYRMLSCADGGHMVTDIEFSDPNCHVQVMEPSHIPTASCHEGGGHSVTVQCTHEQVFDTPKADWTYSGPVPMYAVPGFFVNTTAPNGACPGVCQTTTTACSGTYKAGLCPGGNNVECCPQPTTSCPGQCQQNNLACSGTYHSGLCPGPNNVECCEASSGCLARSTVVQRLVAKANGAYCECVCTHLAPWRCDCSGIASYSWELAAPGQTTSTLPNYSTRLSSWSNMKPGDIILKPSTHVEVFHAWESGTTTFGYCGCHNTADGCSCRTGSTTSYWQANGYYPAHGKNVCA